MSDVLILNKDGRPLSVVPFSAVSWQTAIRLAYQEKVNVMHEYENWIVRSPSVTMNVPAVVITTEYLKWNRQIKYNRTNVLLRDDFRCQFCGVEPGASALTLDHVVPRASGGRTNWSNITTACKPCNHKKGHNPKIVPKKMPHRPNYYELMAKRMKYPIIARDESWLPYLEWPEELIQLRKPKKS